MSGALATAEMFHNAHISFELPPGWACRLEQTQWVYVEDAERNQSSAIIILTAKERKDTDRFDLYEDLSLDTKASERARWKSNWALFTH